MTAPDPASRRQIAPEFANIRGVDRVTPADCALIADGGDAAVSVLKRWGIRRSRGVLEGAIRRLRQVAASGTYGDIAEWEQTAAAVQTVADWYHIALGLPLTPVPAMVAEFAQALQRDDGDIRSQLRFGVDLLMAGLEPQVPDGTASRPDFVVTVDGVPLAVEVKAPATRKAVPRGIEHAARQIRDFDSIDVAAIDVSHAVGAPSFTTGAYHDRERPDDQFRPRFDSFMQHIPARVAGQKGAGVSGRLSGILLYARTLAWHHTDPLSPANVAYTYTGFFTDAHPPGIEAATRRVFDVLHRSLKARSLSPPVPIGR